MTTKQIYPKTQIPHSPNQNITPLPKAIPSPLTIGKQNSKQKSSNLKKPSLKNLKTLIAGIVIISLLVSIIIGLIFLFLKKTERNDQQQNAGELTEIEGNPVLFYDNLTGEIISRSGLQYDGAHNPRLNADGTPLRLSIKQAEAVANDLNSKPTFCVQIPNGMDGARPQVGLHRASIVFEAIAEAGITRFAAIFKNPINQTAIGPIRSLRLYHLDWDTPFDCTIIHAGGADDALSAVSSGYKHLSESHTYMWRASGYWTRFGFSGYAMPNNLFTSGEHLLNFQKTLNTTVSHPQSFVRQTPSEANAERELVGKTEAELNPPKQSSASTNVHQPYDSTKPNTSDSSTSADHPHRTPLPLISNIHVRFNYQAGFNIDYRYHPESNTYFRFFANGTPHLSYTCENTQAHPAPKADCGEATQLNPEVIIVMRVQEYTSPIDNYHEDITTVGSGQVYIFQNGTVFEGTWQKASRTEQIKFKNHHGEEIKLKPGRTWLSAIPNSYGKLSYE